MEWVIVGSFGAILLIEILGWLITGETWLDAYDQLSGRPH